jgi:hypothetical protein
MHVGDVVNRKLLVVVAVAAVLALLAGAKVGRNLLSSSATPTARADVVRFKDEVSKVSIDYPATWTRTELATPDPEIPLVVTQDAGTRMSLRIAVVGIAPVTKKTLPIARKYTDFLLGQDPRVKQFVAPAQVVRGGLPGWRYRYTLGSGTRRAAHDHYFLFKSPYMIQLVFEALPPDRLPAVAGTFDRIAATFRGRVS